MKREAARALVEMLGQTPSEQKAPLLPVEGLIARLKDDAKRLDERYEFAEGDLVCWKPGLELHDCGQQPFLFRRWLKEGERPTNDAPAHSAFWAEGEAMDCVIGTMAGRPDGEFRFIEWVIPSRRLQYYTGEGLPNGGRT
jgi:hypothetical protein